ncbi:hypothetical protein NXS08_05780 [Gleimia sp. 6138-11-ORH1]|uniref:hypothetical protein n=1 Tax=Gleimia sp. 6138-11-ORH1 TaxID=2973937 RepID=UPI00216792B7|nr:hypothetical protein [Gleimia sp. 6138-11-ORH1]MCS4484977.1 hypothetical protein [Gleimia sp. 6138-11-ORH1]
MNSHYSQIIVQNRYTAFEADGLDCSSQDLLAFSIWNAMNGSGTGLWWVGLLELAGGLHW